MIPVLGQGLFTLQHTLDNYMSTTQHLKISLFKVYAKSLDLSLDELNSFNMRLNAHKLPNSCLE
jgi:hypothetical protein